MLDEEFSFPTYLGDTIRVRVLGAELSEPSAEQRARGREAARQLRLAAQWRDPQALLAAQRLHHALRNQTTHFAPITLGASLCSRAHLEQLLDELEREFELGRLIVSEGAFPLLGLAPELELSLKEPALDELPPLPPIAQGAPSETLTFFEARFVDEVGQAIGGLEVEFSAGARVETLTTNPAGVAVLEDVTTMSATARVVSSDALGEIVEPRWDKPRVGTAPTGVNTKSFAFSGAEIAGIGLKPAVPNTVVITPPPEPMIVLLTDEQNEPVPGAAFRIISGGELKAGGDRGSADSSGKVEIRPKVGATSCQITWTTDGGEHARDLFVELGDEDAALERRLHNLGFFTLPARADNVRAFQREFRGEETGKLEDIAQALIAWHDRGVLPSLGPEPEIDNEPFVVEGPADAEDRSDPPADREVA